MRFALDGAEGGSRARAASPGSRPNSRRRIGIAALDIAGRRADRIAALEPARCRRRGARAASRAASLADRARHRRPARADELPEHAVRERQRDHHAVRGHASPSARPGARTATAAAGRPCCSCEMRRGVMGASRRWARSLRRSHHGDVDLRPAREQARDAAVEHGDVRRRSSAVQRIVACSEPGGVLQAPRADDVARAQQLRAHGVRHHHVARDHALDHQQPRVLGVRASRRRTTGPARRRGPPRRASRRHASRRSTGTSVPRSGSRSSSW